MSDVVVDSSVVAKWVLPEVDSDIARRVLTGASANAQRLVILDLAVAEVANAIWKRHRQRLVTLDEARGLLDALVHVPVDVAPASNVLSAGFEIAARYDRSVYDALFVAMAQQLGARGVTADEPLYNVVHADFPQVVLLRHW